MIYWQFHKKDREKKHSSFSELSVQLDFFSSIFLASLSFFSFNNYKAKIVSCSYRHKNYTYSLKAVSLIFATGCQKYSRIVLFPLIISTCAIIPGYMSTSLLSLSNNLFLIEIITLYWARLVSSRKTVSGVICFNKPSKYPYLLASYAVKLTFACCPGSINQYL